MEEHADVPCPVIHIVGDATVRAGARLGPRTIDDYELVYFSEGTDTVYEAGGEPCVLKEPCLIFTRPGEVHSYRFDPRRNVRHLFVHFEHAPLREEEERFGSLLRADSRYMPASHTWLAGAMQTMLRMANHQPPHWKRRLAVMLAAALEELASLYEFPSPPEPLDIPLPIRRAIEYMEEHMGEPITIEEIARRSGWSHEHFTRMFVASLGMSPKRMLLEKRLRRAEDWMLRGTSTIKQIAYAVGFRDEHHFSKIYKQVRGMTASQYIKRCSSDPLFRHTADLTEAHTLYPANRCIPVHD